jgi:hypothetical protein
MFENDIISGHPSNPCSKDNSFHEKGFIKLSFNLRNAVKISIWPLPKSRWTKILPANLSKGALKEYTCSSLTCMLLA